MTVELYYVIGLVATVVGGRQFAGWVVDSVQQTTIQGGWFVSHPQKLGPILKYILQENIN